MAAVVWDQRYNYHIQQFAQDTFGYTAALGGFRQTLQWAGENAAQLPTQTLALMEDRLLAEAHTAAW